MEIIKMEENTKNPTVPAVGIRDWREISQPRPRPVKMSEYLGPAELVIRLAELAEEAKNAKVLTPADRSFF
jgi:hypothetical protein